MIRDIVQTLAEYIRRLHEFALIVSIDDNICVDNISIIHYFKILNDRDPHFLGIWRNNKFIWKGKSRANYSFCNNNNMILAQKYPVITVYSDDYGPAIYCIYKNIIVQYVDIHAIRYALEALDSGQTFSEYYLIKSYNNKGKIISYYLI